MARLTLRLLTAAVVLAALTAAPVGAVETYRLVVHTGQSKSTNAQLHTLLKEAAEASKKELNVLFDYKIANTLEEFMAALGKGEVDIGYSLNYQPYLTVRERGTHQPVLSAGFYKTKTEEMCLYVGTNTPFKTVADLKKAHMATYKGEEVYYMLWDLVGQDPSAYFASLKATPNGFSTAFSVAMGDMDAGFIATSTMAHMQEINPFTKKKIRKLKCWGPALLMPMFVSRKVPKRVVDRLTDSLVNWKTEKTYERLRPLLRKTGLLVFPVTDKDFDWLANIRKKGRDGKWQDAYEGWVTKAEASKGE